MLELIGYRRLYDALGCSIEGESDVHLSFDSTPEFYCEVNIGAHPRFGVIVKEPTFPYAVPGEMNLMMKMTHYLDASVSPYPRKFFTEIICLRRTEIDDEISRKFRSDDKTTISNYFEIARTHHRAISEILDLIQGTIGLRFHRQLILLQLDEMTVAVKEPLPAIQFASDSLEILDAPNITKNGATALKELLPGLGHASDKAKAFGSIVLEWLARSWREHDLVFKFLSLFIPLELCIHTVHETKGESQDERSRRLKALVARESSAEDQELVKFVDHLLHSLKPSLVDRFSRLALVANLSTRDQDIEAFKAFNKLRNALVHRGDKNVALATTLRDETTKRLEDLVERYVAFTLFRDASVYQSRWREKSSSITTQT